MSVFIVIVHGRYIATCATRAIAEASVRASYDHGPVVFTGDLWECWPAQGKIIEEQVLACADKL